MGHGLDKDKHLTIHVDVGKWVDWSSSILEKQNNIGSRKFTSVDPPALIEGFDVGENFGQISSFMEKMDSNLLPVDQAMDRVLKDLYNEVEVYAEMVSEVANEMGLTNVPA